MGFRSVRKLFSASFARHCANCSDVWCLIFWSAIRTIMPAIMPRSGMEKNDPDTRLRYLSAFANGRRSLAGHADFGAEQFKPSGGLSGKRRKLHAQPTRSQNHYGSPDRYIRQAFRETGEEACLSPEKAFSSSVCPESVCFSGIRRLKSFFAKSKSGKVE